ncbi:hypothetical protein AMS68_007055 [Peltaster fructicola]|uniref:DUF7603 domain-containing protein n=1 Tax=Peltaster fructicola TaxID=286661 RepID=A0A6H0Y3X2_9PEZI|nr:hypothetical protein AMS68_007055 [Peltaster fructicola]
MADEHFAPQSLKDDDRPKDLHTEGSPLYHLTSAASSTANTQRNVKKQNLLANIAVPSFLTFRSQVSSIPPSKTVVRGNLQRPDPSPRHFSFAAEPSPRLVDHAPRPVSVHTLVPDPFTTEGRTQDSIYASQRRAHDRNASIDSRIADRDIPLQRSSISVRKRPTHRQTASINSRRSRNSSMNGNTLKPSMTLEFNGVQRTLSNESLSTDSSDKRPKSPGRIGAFFGWNKTSPHKGGTESPTTTFSDRSLSPQPSPRHEKTASMARLAPAGLDIEKANHARYMDSPITPIMVDTPGTASHVQELERELAHVSAELAGSIRREMDLEDEIDRLKSELPSIPPSEMSRRGSDYFSDSGAGSVRYPISDPDAKIEEVERHRRRAEQDKAQMKLDIAQKLQVELARRRELEEHIHNLEDRLERRSQEDGERKERRVEELEAQLEDTRRRLNQEKEAKENFEDLYTALQQEFTSGRRGLGRGFGSIAEESDDVPHARSGLSRSGSLARSGSLRGGSLNRSGSVKDRPDGRQRSGSISTPVTAEGLKEIEDQRDALQKALKLLISRYEKQQKDHERHVKKLGRQSLVTDRAAGTSTPQRTKHQREVSILKEEVTTLRKRTEDALEQKWQYEKSLGGIKMDLDRAEQETRGLRTLLREHDIMAPSPRTLHTATFSDADAMLSAAESDREQAKRLAEEFRHRAAQLQRTGSTSPDLAQLKQAAARMDQLSQQFDDQSKTNNELRDRLAAAVEKGEREQTQSTKQIEEMQKRLASMEDSVLAAQQHSETTLSTHETELRAIEETNAPQLHRLRFEVPEPSKLSPISPGMMRNRLRSKSVGNKKFTPATLLEASRTNMLERKVRDLERLLRDAEDDVEYVVQRVNKSQFEVAELSNERDAAFTQMRKLQDRLVEEAERAETLLARAAEEAERFAARLTEGQLDGANDSGSDYGD